MANMNNTADYKENTAEITQIELPAMLLKISAQCLMHLSMLI